MSNICPHQPCAPL